MVLELSWDWRRAVKLKIRVMELERADCGNKRRTDQISVPERFSGHLLEDPPQGVGYGQTWSSVRSDGKGSPAGPSWAVTVARRRVQSARRRLRGEWHFLLWTVQPCPTLLGLGWERGCPVLVYQ